jgi:hypothetical protein
MSDGLSGKRKGLGIKESCIEWLKGCSNTVGGHPEDCEKCTVVFREHIEKLVTAEYEAMLMELFAFIKGTGNCKFLGPGIHTYPGRDERNRQIFDACLVLEERGMIERSINQPDYVVWVAKGINEGGPVI